jgi:hypothetical protein
MPLNGKQETTTMTRKPIAGQAAALVNLKRLSTVAAGIALTAAAAGFTTPSLAGPSGCPGKGFIGGGRGTDGGCRPPIKGGGGPHGGGHSTTTTIKTTTKAK